MCKPFILLLLLTARLLSAQGQVTPAEMERLRKMSPREQEIYQQQLLQKYSRQARDLSRSSGIPINEDLLPDAEWTAPAKQVKKLASLPRQPLARPALLNYTARLEEALLKKAGREDHEWLKRAPARMHPFQQHNLAAGAWYANQPLRALLLQLKTVRLYPDQWLAWNNLGAMLQGAGLPEKAIPVLQYCLARQPQHTIVLNNLGQCYLQLGDLAAGRTFLQQCLSVAPLNPDANHSMGMISLYEKNEAAARAYFEKALQVAQRASTVAAYIRAGGKLNLAEWRQKKYGWSGKRPKNYFDNLALEQFDVEFFPRSMEDVKPFRQKMAAYNASVEAEINYWTQRSAGGLTAAEQAGYRHSYRSVYSEIVDAMLEKLQEEFDAGYLALPFEPSDVSTIQQAAATCEEAIRQIDETIVAPAGSDWNTQEAWRRMRCEKKKAALSQQMARHNAIIEKRYKLLKSRWKSYINQLLPILALDPTPGHRAMAYAAMSGYFSMLRGITGSALAPEYPMDCQTDMTLEQATALLQSARDLKLECPDIFQLQGEVLGVEVDLNCDGLKIEAGMESEPVGVGYEKNFKTGMSTLWLGLGLEGALDFDGKELGEGKIANQFFISFDRHNQFADAGYRGQASFEGRGDQGIDFNYSFAMNAGFDGRMETSGIFEGVETWFE